MFCTRTYTMIVCLNVFLVFEPDPPPPQAPRQTTPDCSGTKCLYYGNTMCILAVTYTRYLIPYTLCLHPQNNNYFDCPIVMMSRWR